MPEVLGDPPSPRTALFWNGAAWQWARVDAAGHLQIDVLTIAAGVDVATAANQALMITALQLIDNLVVALGGPGNVRLQVRGEDQLFSIDKILISHRSAVISGADGWIDSHSPIAGEYWIVTNVVAWDEDNANTAHHYIAKSGAPEAHFHSITRAIAANEYTSWSGHLFLDEDATVRVLFTGGLAGDNCNIDVTGYVMTLEV